MINQSIMSNSRSSTEITALFELQRAYSLHLRTSDAQQRIASLHLILSWINSHQEEIREVVHKDFKKPYPEIDLTEIFAVTQEIKYAIKHLKNWMSTKKVKTPLTHLGSSSYIQYEPKGTSLIIAPWNYPFNLSISPLISAIAAGCTAIIKPSEMTPHTSGLVNRMITEIFNKQEVAVIEGGVEETTQLLDLPFDHIFFTGSPAVGKIVMKAAAQHLTSVTLELGGKSPAIIDKSVKVKDAAEKIAWGKFVNCGQTCIAPDYLWLHESVKQEFTEHLFGLLIKMYDPNQKGAKASADYARIVNQKHFQRIKNLLEDALSKGAKVTFGGGYQEEENFIEPTILEGVTPEMEVLQEEIFGPLLPIMAYSDIQEPINYINSRPKPLALYVFSEEEKTVEKILQETSAGGCAINDCVNHYLQKELPFGGVNNSGIGKAHGHYGFIAFSNEKGVLHQQTTYNALKILHPPYTESAKKLIQKMLKWL
jgi:aldehyde dehydrogenase (NAD+)